MSADSQFRVSSSSERRVNRGVDCSWRRELRIRNLSMTSAATFVFNSIYKMFIFYVVTPAVSCCQTGGVNRKYKGDGEHL